jgi:glutamine synthetase
VAKASKAKAAEGGALPAHVHVGLFDTLGVFRGKRLPRAAFAQAFAEGWRFIDSLPFWMPDETCFEEKGYVDEAVTIDPGLRPFPFEPDAALAVADYAGPSAAITPRPLLKAQIAKAAAMGLRVEGGFEFETIYLAEDGASLRAKGWSDLAPALPHNRCWSAQAPAADADFLTEVSDGLRAAGIDLAHDCMELGPGCVEYCLGPSPLLKAADDAGLFKLFTKAMARRRGMTASFMAQLDAGFPGLCGHLTLSLTDAKGKPVLHDPAAPDGLSALGRAFLGGIVALTPELMAMFAPTVNAYRRLRPGNWAPRSATWGLGNYSCGVRAVTRTASEARLEFRLPGADVGPHLCAAMMLGAGLWGVERGADPGPAVTGNGRLAPAPSGQELPTSLEDAARRLRASAAARAIFGDAFTDHHASWCAAESAAFHAHVSAYERARYLEIL